MDITLRDLWNIIAALREQDTRSCWALADDLKETLVRANSAGASSFDIRVKLTD